MINDYKNWFLKKQEIIHHLSHHDSIIITKVENVIKVLNYISKLKEEEIDEDLSVIFDCGFSYIYQVIDEVEIYLEKYFENNMYQFLNYELLINYNLYINDLKDSLIENEYYTDEINEELNFISNNIENIISEKRPFIEKVLDEYDNRLMTVINPNVIILTTPEVYDRIYEELQILEGHIDE